MGFFENGHIKNVQNRFLESLSHTEILPSFSLQENKKRVLDKGPHFEFI
jgi:hypothetical protein